MSIFKRRPVVKDLFTTTIFGTVGKGSGFLIPFFIAGWFGASGETDAFFFALGLAQFLSIMLTSTLSTIIVPYIAELRAQNGDIERFTGSVIVVSTAILSGLTALFLPALALAIPAVTRFAAGSFSLSLLLYAELIPLVFFLMYGGILDGILNAYKLFSVPAITPALRSALTIIVIFVFKDAAGIHAIGLGYVLGECVRVAAVWGALVLKKYPIPRLSLKLHPLIPQFLKKSSWQAAAAIVFSFAPVIDKIMASWLSEGSVSLLYYGDRLYFAFVEFMMVGLIVTLLSHWSEEYYAGGGAGLRKNVKKAAWYAAIVCVPISLFAGFLGRPIMGILYGFGSFDQPTLSTIGLVFSMYMAGFAPYVLAQVYARAHIVLKNTATILFCAIVLAGLNIVLNLVFMRTLGEAGIALATSIVNFIGFAVFFGAFMIKIKKGANRKNP